MEEEATVMTAVDITYYTGIRKMVTRRLCTLVGLRVRRRAVPMSGDNLLVAIFR